MGSGSLTLYFCLNTWTTAPISTESLSQIRWINPGLVGSSEALNPEMMSGGMRSGTTMVSLLAWTTASSKLPAASSEMAA